MTLRLVDDESGQVPCSAGARTSLPFERSFEGSDRMGGSHRVCTREERTVRMKIYSIEVETDLGRRVIKLSAPIDVDARGDMPKVFRSLTELLWDSVRNVAAMGRHLTPPKAEA